VDPNKKVPDLNFEVRDLLLEVVDQLDLKQEVSDLRSGGIPPPNLTSGIFNTYNVGNIPRFVILDYVVIKYF